MAHKRRTKAYLFLVVGGSAQRRKRVRHSIKILPFSRSARTSPKSKSIQRFSLALCFSFHIHWQPTRICSQNLWRCSNGLFSVTDKSGYPLFAAFVRPPAIDFSSTIICVRPACPALPTFWMTAPPSAAFTDSIALPTLSASTHLKVHVEDVTFGFNVQVKSSFRLARWNDHRFSSYGMLTLYGGGPGLWAEIVSVEGFETESIEI